MPKLQLKVDNKLNASLRAVTEANLKDLKKLNLLLFPDIYYSPNFYKDVLASGFYSRLAYIEEAPVGMVCCSVEGRDVDEEQFDLIIMTIGVLAQYRSEGVGSVMMRHILSVAKHDDRIQSIYLHVKVDNELAIQFYERFGFAVKELKKNYYVRMEPPDAYVMELKLQES